MQFIRFALHCILDGWELADHAFAVVEGLCVLAGAGIGLLWWKTHKVRNAWEKSEKRIMMGAFALFVIIFLGSSFFYAPFKRTKDSETNLEATLTTLSTASNDLRKALADLKASEDERLKLLEHNQISSANDPTAMVRALLAENNLSYAQALTNEDPRTAKLAAIAAGSHLSHNTPISLQTLRAEQKEVTAQELAKQRLATIKASQAHTVAYGTFVSRTDSLLRAMTNQLWLLASEVGDRVYSTYDHAPPSLSSNLTNYATIRLERNSLWNFTVSLSNCGDYWALTVNNHSEPKGTELTMRGSTINSYAEFFQDRTQIGSAEDDGTAASIISKGLRTFLRSYDSRFPLTNVAVSPK